MRNMEERNKYSVIYSSNALDDLRRIFKYITFFYGERYLNKFNNELDKHITLLEIFPELYPECRYSFHGSFLRKLPFKGYIIFYTIDHSNSEVIIINIFNELENIDSKF